MTRNTTLREKGQALFLAALMVLSVFAMSAAFAGAAVADEHDDTLEDGERYWQGQNLLTTAGTANETYDIYTVDDGEPDEWVREVQFDSNGELVLDTARNDLDGKYVLLISGDDTSINESDIEFEIRVQTLEAEFEQNTVRTDNTGTLVLLSNRASYDVKVSADGLSNDRLEQMFPGAAEQDGDVVFTASEEVEVDFTDVEPGEYSFEFDVVDTSATASVDVTVAEDTDAVVGFDSSTYTEHQGDVVEVTVEMDNTDEANVTVGSEEVNYLVTLNVTDTDDSGSATFYLNTRTAGQNADESTAYWAGEGSSISDVQRHTDELTKPLETGDYDLEAALSGEEDPQDVAALVISERSTDGVSVAVAPDDATYDDVDELRDIATERSEVAEGDQVVVAVQASGIWGTMIEEGEGGDELRMNSNAFDAWLVQTNPGTNQEAKRLDLDNSHLVEDHESDTYYFVVDLDETEFEDGDEVRAHFRVNADEFAYLDHDTTKKSSGNEHVHEDFSVVDREATLDGVDNDDHLDIEIDETKKLKATLSGDSTVAPGTELRIRLRSTSDSATAFIHTQTVEVDADGQWETEFDLEEREVGDEFTIQIRSGSDNIAAADYTGAIVDPTVDTHSVTVTVVDEDGNAIPDASVTADGESASTNVKGQAVLELADGEHTVSASADGYEDGDSKVTVDGDSEVTVTLTAEEDKKGADDDDDSNAGADDDSSTDDDAQGDDSSAGDDDSTDGDEDQPGFGVIVALVALLAAAGLALRRQ